MGEKKRLYLPMMDNLLGRMTRHRTGKDYEDPLTEKSISQRTLETLRHSQTWKAPGEDGVPGAVYKILPTARNFLVAFVAKSLRGEKRIKEDDMKARVVLIHKRDGTGLVPSRPVTGRDGPEQRQVDCCPDHGLQDSNDNHRYVNQRRYGGPDGPGEAACTERCMGTIRSIL